MVDSRGLHKRLDALNRVPLPSGEGPGADVDEVRRRLRKLRKEAPPGPAERILYRRDLPRAEAKPRMPDALSGPAVVLEDAVEGAEAEAPHGGKAFLITNRLAEIGQGRLSLRDDLAHELAGKAFGLWRRFSGAPAEGSPAPEDMVFVDLETTGLASTPLFLIGTLVWEGGAPVVQQYFARDYTEERAVISLFVHGAARKGLLVSFNGRTFDLPYMRIRAAANRVPFNLNIAHLDMLHECRRAWRRLLPDCRLQTLENRICGHTRRSDIPGSEIPEAYHAFVRTGNAARIVQVLEHNMLDLVTLAELVVRLPLAR